jgi:hypothetical protein
MMSPYKRKIPGVECCSVILMPYVSCVFRITMYTNLASNVAHLMFLKKNKDIDVLVSFQQATSQINIISKLKSSLVGCIVKQNILCQGSVLCPRTGRFWTPKVAKQAKEIFYKKRHFMVWIIINCFTSCSRIFYLRRFSTPEKFNVNKKERICTAINWI